MVLAGLFADEAHAGSAGTPEWLTRPGSTSLAERVSECCAGCWATLVAGVGDYEQFIARVVMRQGTTVLYAGEHRVSATLDGSTTTPPPVVIEVEYAGPGASATSIRITPRDSVFPTTARPAFAVTAMGSAPHLAGKMIEEATGGQWVYVPYKGGSQAINDTIAGQTDILINGMLATLPFVQSKRLKVLAVSKPTRVPLLPQVPTIAETLPNFESGTWQGVVAPASTPAPVVQKISTELLRVIRLPAVREMLVAQGAEVSTMSAPDAGKFFETERKNWAALVTRTGLKLE